MRRSYPEKDSKHIKTLPIKRARQDDPKDTNLTRAKPNPATKNAPETPKTQLFITPTSVKGDPENAFTRHAP